MTSQKLPRKETLLPKQDTPKKETTTAYSGENPEVKKSGDDAVIAANYLKKRDSEIQLKLKEEGYKSLEEGLADVKRKIEESDKLLKYAQDKEREIAEQLAKLEKDKQQLVNAYAIDKKMKDMTDARLEEAIKLEKKRKSEENNHNTMIEELNYLIKYHQEHIAPCRRSLLFISQSIYNWVDTLTRARIDFTPLYNHIGNIMKTLDQYIDTEDFIPPNKDNDKKQTKD